MFLTDIMKKGLQNLKMRKVSTALNITLLTLSLVIILAAEMFMGAFNTAVGRMFYAPDSRTIIFSIFETEETDFDEFKKKYEKLFEGDDRIEYIGEYYSMQSKETNLSSIVDGIPKDNYNMYLNSYNTAYDKYINKEDVVIEKNEIYVPKYINYKSEYMEDIDSEIEYLEGDRLVGKTIKIKHDIIDFDTSKRADTYEIELKVAGTYDNFAIGNSAFEVLASPELLKELYETNYKFTDGSDISREEYDYYINDRKLQIIVKDYEDVDDVKEYLKDRTGHDFDTIAILNDNVYVIGNVINAVKYAGFILIILSIVNITFSMIKSIAKRKKEFALLSAIGYRNRCIYGMLAAEIGIIAAIAISISLVIYNIASVIVNSYVDGNMDMMFASVDFAIPLHIWIIRILMFLAALSVAVLFAIERIKKIVPAKVLKGDS